MLQRFHVPTRIIHGEGAVAELPALCRELGMTRPLVVTDANIAATAFFKCALEGLDRAGIPYTVFADCAIDARLRHIDAEGSRARSGEIDGIIGIGGGSVMCTAKGIGIVATNGGSFADYNGVGRLNAAPLPNVMVPTTAGSGSEVSGVSVVLDDARNVKFTVRDPRQYPDAALLDPEALRSCPERLAVHSAMDALAHAVEGYLSPRGSAVTRAYGLEAAHLLVRCAHAAAIGKEMAAMADNLLAASMANISFGSTGVGMGHVLAAPLEETYHIPHGVAVGVILPRFVEAAAVVHGARLAPLGRAFGLELNLGDAPSATASRAAAAQIATRLYALYESLGFPKTFDPATVDPPRHRDMAEGAVVFTRFGAKPDEEVTDATKIESGNGHDMTVADAVRVYESSTG